MVRTGERKFVFVLSLRTPGTGYKGGGFPLPVVSEGDSAQHKELLFGQYNVTWVTGQRAEEMFVILKTVDTDSAIHICSVIVKPNLFFIDQTVTRSCYNLVTYYPIVGPLT